MYQHKQQWVTGVLRCQSGDWWPPMTMFCCIIATCTVVPHRKIIWSICWLKQVAPNSRHRNRATSKAKRTLLCHCKRDTSVSLQKGHFFVIAKRTLLCHCKKNTSLSLQKGHFLCHCKKDTSVPLQKGHFYVIAKGVLLCHCKKDTCVIAKRVYYCHYKNDTSKYACLWHCCKKDTSVSLQWMHFYIIVKGTLLYLSIKGYFSVIAKRAQTICKCCHCKQARFHQYILWANIIWIIIIYCIHN